MKPTSFAKYLTDFFTLYLSKQKNVSHNTIRSYRDTFKLLLTYCQTDKGISTEKLMLSHLSSEWLIDFLEWLETDRKCSIATRNQRLAFGWRNLTYFSQYGFLIGEHKVCMR